MQMAGLFVAPTADQDPLVNLTKPGTFKAHDDVSSSDLMRVAYCHLPASHHSISITILINPLLNPYPCL